MERYWDLHFRSKLKEDLPSIVDELENRIQSTIKYHLVADVPVGAFLSGGLDSRMVVAKMRNFNRGTLNTFSGDVPYEGHSEITYARAVSERYQTENHELCFTPSLAMTLPKVVWHLDEPSDPFSICMYYISEIARKEVKVVLGGDGGDELFGGYDRYYGNQYASYLAILPKSFRKHILSKILKRIPEGFWYRSLTHRAKWLNYISLYEGGERYSRGLSYFYFNNGTFDNLYTEPFRKDVSCFNPEGSVRGYFDKGSGEDIVDRMLYADYMTRLPDHPVMILDRMTMAHGLEARSPFLDHELVEFCAKIPSRFKIRGTRCRFIQLELGKRLLPKMILERKKQGFASPLAYILNKEYSRFHDTLLSDSRLAREGFLRQEVIDNVVTEHLEKKVDHGQRLWLLTNLEIWYRMYIEGISMENISMILERGRDSGVD